MLYKCHILVEGEEQDDTVVQDVQDGEQENTVVQDREQEDTMVQDGEQEDTVVQDGEQGDTVVQDGEQGDTVVQDVEDEEDRPAVPNSDEEDNVVRIIT